MMEHVTNSDQWYAAGCSQTIYCQRETLQSSLCPLARLMKIFEVATVTLDLRRIMISLAHPYPRWICSMSKKKTYTVSSLWEFWGFLLQHHDQLILTYPEKAGCFWSKTRWNILVHHLIDQSNKKIYAVPKYAYDYFSIIHFVKV